MATKTQREFKKNMKKFEKEGKVPSSYYPTRKYRGSGKATAIITTIVILFFMSGYIRNIYYIVRNMFAPPETAQYYNIISPNQTELNVYSAKTENIDNLIYDLYLDIYRNYFEGNPIEESKFIEYKKNLLLEYKNIETDSELLTDIYNNYKDSLDISVEMVEFSISHYNTNLTQTEKQYLETLLKKSTDMQYKRDELFQKVWDIY